MNKVQATKREGKETPYPPLLWIRQQLRYNDYSSIRTKVLEAYVVGSRARGTATAKSDLDIALVLPARKRISSLRLTENYHSNFTDQSQKPQWNGIIVDFQFFYPGDSHLNGYRKIPIPKKAGHTTKHKKGATNEQQKQSGPVHGHTRKQVRCPEDHFMQQFERGNSRF